MIKDSNNSREIKEIKLYNTSIGGEDFGRINRSSSKNEGLYERKYR